MFGIAVTSATYYYWYELVKQQLEGGAKKTLSITENMLTGAIAGAGFTVLNLQLYIL